MSSYVTENRDIGAHDSPFMLIKDMDRRCLQIALESHKNQYRDSGALFWDHLLIVKESTDYIFQPSEYKNIFLDATLLHDVNEQGKLNRRQVYVVNPYQPKTLVKGLVYLNMLLSDFGEEGRMICYIVNGITHEPDINYMDYMNKRIFSFYKDGIMRDADIGKCGIKICDRDGNTDPEENVDEDFCNKRFLELREREELDIFLDKYRGYKWASKYNISEKDISFGDFFDISKEALIRKGLANSWDNVSYYMPKAERVLLEGTTKDDRRLFYEDRMKEIISRCNSNSICKLQKYKDYIDEELISKVGFNRP